MRMFKLTIMIVMTAIILSSCMDTEKNKLTNRAETYWDFKVNKDFKSAYNFLSPGWKKSDSELAYIQRMSVSKVSWLSSKLSKKDCSQPDLCQVTMTIEYEYMSKLSGAKKIKVESSINETWIMKDNIWYHLPMSKKLSQ